MLPAWVRRIFWCVVALEWTVVACLLGICGMGVYWAGRYLTCADAETVYASGYSDAAWAGIKPGDTQATVRERLGEPLQRWEQAEEELWSYSRHGVTSDDYRERKVRFDMAGRTVEKHEECYLD